jgi:predicted dehydrogenase
MTDVRWALAGFGAGGRVVHAPMIAAAEGIDLAAVVSTNPARAEQARELGLDVCADLTSLVAMGVEGVTITTPAGTHVELAHQALDAGLHVVVDKPFALTAAEAAGVVEHAAHAGRVLTVYQNRRWDGDLLTVADEIRTGSLGRIRRFWSRIERFHPDLPAWTTQLTSERGGGVLVDLGPHLIDQAVYLFGRVRSVYAELATFGADAAAANDVVLNLSHVEGVRSTIVASLAAAVEGPRFQVNGDLGGLLIDGFDIQEEQLFAGQTPATLGEKWGQEPADRLARLMIGQVSSTRPLLNGEWPRFYPAVARSVRDGAPVPVDPADAVHVCEIFDAARLSAVEARVVDI